MKKPFVFIAALIAAFLSFNLNAFAGKEIDPPPTPKPTVVFSSTVEAGYMLDGTVFYPGTYVKSYLDIAWQNGLSLNFWYANDFKAGQSGADEFDFTISYQKKVGDYNLGLSIAYFDLARLGESSTDFLDIKLSVARTFEYGKHGLTPFFEADYYVPVNSERGTFLEQGWIYEVGLRHNMPLSEKVTFNQCLAGVYDEGAFASDSGFLFTYGASLDFKVTKKLCLSIGGKYYFLASNFDDSRGRTGNRGTASAGFTYTF